MKFTPRPYQLVGRDFLKARNFGMLGDSCVSGDTEISIWRRGITRKTTIAEAFKKKNTTWRPEFKTFVRGLKDNGLFGLIEVNDILYKGVRACLKITTASGKTLTITPDHRVLTPGGWIEAGALQVGSVVLTNGQLVCVNPECRGTKDIIVYPYAKFKGHCRACMYKFLRTHPSMPKEVKRTKSKTDGYIYLTGEPLRFHPRMKGHGILEHVYLMEQKLGRVLEKDEEVHHINRIRDDNRVENLVVLSRQEHKKLHQTEKHFGTFTHWSGSQVVMSPKEDAVVSIERAGKQPVYDLACEAPNNFLANKIVIHNCGIGKTGQAILSVEKDWRVLVVCPASVKAQWQQAFLDWCDRPSTIIDSSKQPINAWQNAFTFIVNYDLLVRDQVLFQLNRIQWDCIICDESHKIKSLTAKRTKAVLTMKGLRGRTRRMWFLTGTPIKNRPIDLFPVLRSCAPDVLGPYNTYMKFAYRYCGAYQSKFGLDVSGASHLDDLREKMKSFMLRREKRDVLTELPPRVVIHNQMKCTETVKELIRDEEARTMEQAGERDPALFKLGEVQRIRGALAKHKVPLCVEYIKDLLESEDKIVVFYYHKEVLRELQKAFGETKSVYIDGSVQPGKRGDIVRGFHSDADTRLFFGQMEACGEGIDGLQSCSSTAVFVEPSWSHTDIEQCIGRLERSGQRNDINVHILTIKDTLEARMLEVVAEKLRTDAVLYGTNNPTKEKENMAKPNKKQEAAEALAKALTQFMMAYDTEAEVPTKEVEEAPADPVKPTKAPVAQPVEPVKDADVTEESIRSRCGDICAALPAGGRDKCAAVIKKIGGGKIVDLKTPAMRLQAMDALDKLYGEVTA